MKIGIGIISLIAFIIWYVRERNKRYWEKEDRRVREEIEERSRNDKSWQEIQDRHDKMCVDVAMMNLHRVTRLPDEK